ncbi:MAG TPA: hypothetical protein VFA55_09170 [Candidatus Kapabacteria bacterium]|nr:hypothetical protein [Candidatus Kapabacteria bacterium]
MEEKDIITGVHKALDTYEIQVNGSINETKTLKGWVQTLVTDNRNLYNVTKELRDKQELRSARSKVLAAFLHSRMGKIIAGVWKYIKIPILTAIGSVIAYYLIRWLDPTAFPHVFI